MLFIILVPPTIEPSDNFVAATEKTRTLLLCETHGLPAPNIRWYKDGVELNPQANPRFVVFLLFDGSILSGIKFI